ncbi:GntR family transcriptional regulator [Planctomicrobium piriforme]|uniref:DNA-binding transcriptional regulator, GntR family n=1 Tax=Planctomicrobium piriforme TaxID=1576369 RepID=A0A1I3MI13_9PLAN|nr:GntR family transcriptional regulator [Planctomicrobium piriforme]SFI96639.1 DNA-binding transcriptional regulator, GntR family [Planctomicrobium piriforme]
MSIVEYIKTDLENRLRTGRPLPQKMTLESVASLYQVSITPVRMAVNELIAEGLLLKGKNRRLTPVHSVGESAADLTTDSPAPPEPPKDLLEIVANDLVRLSLQGEQVQLREEATAEKYSVSRSAIRNVFHRLAGSGLLKHLPRRGWVVRPFRQEDMRAFLEVRELLELKALDAARNHLRDEDLKRMLDGNQYPASDSERPLIDNSLHAYMIEKAANPYVQDFFERHGRYYDILFQWEDEDREAAIETVRQHREILEALLLRDWRTARKALSWHIQCNHPILSKIVDRQRGDDANPVHAPTAAPVPTTEA